MSRALYLIVLIAAACFYPLYRDDLSYLTLISVLILPVIMLLQLVISAVFLKYKAVGDNIAVYKGSEGEIRIDISNRSVFPLSNVKIRVRTRFLPSGETSGFSAVVPVPALRTQTVTVNVGAEHCGTAEVYVEYIKIYDLLRLFSVKLGKGRMSGKIYIVPKISESHREYAKALMSAASQASEDTSADDVRPAGSGDVAGFREYAAGDRLSLIHHKLSARFDTDMVKVMSGRDGARYLLTADLSREELAEDLDLRDEILERFMSCAYYIDSWHGEVYAAVPDNAECGGERLSSGKAVRYEGGSSYFAIAKALSGSDYSGAGEHSGYIRCDMDCGEF